MMNKAINTLVLATVDSITKFKNKLAYYLAIFAMVFGSTFGTINSANAIDITAGATWNVNDVSSALDDGVTGILTADIDVKTNAATILIDTTASQITDATAIALGDISDSASGVATLSIVNQASADFNLVLGINSINIDGALDYEADDASGATSATKTLTIAADSSTGTRFEIDNNDVTDGVDMIVDMNGNLTVGAKAASGSGGGQLLVTALGATTGPVVSSTTLKISGNLTAKGVAGAGVDAIVLDDLAAGTAGVATLQFDGQTAQTITGEIDGSGAKEGKLLISGTGTVASFSNKIGVGAQVRTIQIAAGAEAKFADIIDTFELDLDNDITVSENNNVIGVGDTGSLNIANAAIVTIDDSIAAGESVFKTDATDDAAGVVIGTGGHTVNLPSNFTTGTITYIDGADQTLDSTMISDTVVTDTALTDYTAALANTNVDIAITATAKSTATTASELSVTTNMAKALKEANLAAKAGSSSDSGAVDGMTTVLNAGTTTDTTMAQQAAPQTDMISGSTFATKAMTGSLQGIMSNRMASLRSGDAFMTGMSAGNGMSANSGFIQAFGTEAEQKNKTVGSGTQFGYDASSAGLALGFDGITDNGSVVGLSLSMSNTDVDGKGTGNSKNDIDSYTASIYAG